MTPSTADLETVEPECYSIEVNTTCNADWDRLVAEFDDATVYQTAMYSHVRMNGLFYERLILRRNGKVVGLCVARLYRIPFLPIGLALVNFGPLWRHKSTKPDLTDLRKMLQQLRAHFCRRLGLRLKISPAIYECEEQAAELCRIFEQEGFVAKASGELTPIMNLADDLVTLRKNLDQKWRNRLNAAERHGLKVTISASLEDFDRFLVVYLEMRKRKQYRSSENVPQFRTIFASTEEALRSRIILCWMDDMPLAGAVISSLGDTALYLYGATADDGLKLQAANLVHWSVIKWAKENNFLRYDLMSVSQVAPWFKRGLCGKNGFNTRRLGPFIAEGGVINMLVLRVIGLVIDMIRK